MFANGRGRACVRGPAHMRRMLSGLADGSFVAERRLQGPAWLAVGSTMLAGGPIEKHGAEWCEASVVVAVTKE